jgi:hypothetical protein
VGCLASVWVSASERLMFWPSCSLARGDPHFQLHDCFPFACENWMCGLVLGQQAGSLGGASRAVGKSFFFFLHSLIGYNISNGLEFRARGLGAILMWPP